MGAAPIPKRIRWYADSAHVIFPGSESKSVFGWYEHTHYWDADRNRRWPRTKPEWVLLLDGRIQDSLKNLVEIKCLIIRLAYNIHNRFAIPSELLSAAGLHYNNNFWLDSWNLLEDPEQHWVETVGESFQIPPQRRLILEQEGQASLRPVAKPKIKPRPLKVEPEQHQPKRKIGFWEELSSWMSPPGTYDYGLTDDECTIYLD